MGEFAIGQGVSRFEDPRLVQGGGRYTDDVVYPGMAFGVVLRSPHAHAKIKSIDTAAAKAAPGVLAVITGADWKAAGLGDLPVAWRPQAPRRLADVQARYTVLAEDRVRWVGDCVAFVVAETAAQAHGRRRTDRGRLRGAARGRLHRRGDRSRARPRVWDDCADNICFVELIGDKAAADAAFAKAAHVVKHRFVINRVTAASMEPRGAVGHYHAGDGRYTIHTPTQRAHGFRADLAQILKVPESKVHVTTGDIGGSFGMKTPVFNETPLVLLASKLTGRPVKWMSTRTEAFLSDAQARDNVTEAELALDKDGNFLALRVKTIAAIGAYLQNNMPAFFLNAGTLAGTYRTPAMYVDITAVFTNTNPVRPYRGNGRPEAGFVIERMVDLAAGRTQASIRPSCAGAITSRPAQMPFKTGLTFTYDCGEFEKNMDLALELADFAGFDKRRKEARKRAASCAASASPTPSSAPPPPAPKAPRCASTAAAA